VATREFTDIVGGPWITRWVGGSAARNFAH